MWFSNRRAKFRREEKLRQQKREVGGAASYGGGTGAAAGNGAASMATNNMLGPAGSGLAGTVLGAASVGSAGAGTAAHTTAGGALGLLQSGGFASPLAAYGSFAYGLPNAATASNATANSFGDGFGCAIHI